MNAQDKCTVSPVRTPRTIRQEISEQADSLQEQLARLAKLEHTLPAKWLSMTREEVWEKAGIHIHF